MMHLWYPCQWQEAPQHCCKDCICLERHVLAQKARELQKPSELITIALLLAFTLGSLDAHLLVVLLECCQILASFAELTLFHTLADIPVNESTLGVHEVKLVIDA